MSDLSNLLGSVYGDGNADAAPVRHEPPADDRGPAWDDDARLDEAFQGWTPGPGPDAPAHEREMVGADGYHIEEPADPDADLANALSAALAAETRGPAPAPQPQPHQPPAAQAPPAPPVMPPVAAQPTMAAAPPPQPAPQPQPAAPAMPAMPKEQAYAAPVAPAVAPTMPAAVQVPSWQFGDDDIYPMGRKGKKR